MSLLPLLMKTSDPNTAFTSHLDNYKYALSNLVTSIEQDCVLLSIDVKDYEPNEVTVATIDNTIIVEGKHEDNDDMHNTRHFIRKYALPATIDIDDLTTFSSDGLFTIYVSSKLKSKSSSRIASPERIVSIEQIDKPVAKKYQSAERVIPIELTDEIVKLPIKVQELKSRKMAPKVLRFKNIDDSVNDIREPEERLIKKKLGCCCQ